MNWKDILKSDPCTMETKEMLYNTLQKLGANNELLDEIKNTQIDDLREMIEELIRTTKHPTQVKIFKQILRNWDMCIVESQRNPIQQANMGGSNKDFPQGFSTKNAMLQSPLPRLKALKFPYIKEAIAEVAEEKEGKFEANLEFTELIKQVYTRKLLEAGYPMRSITQHVRHKLDWSRAKYFIGKILGNLGYTRKHTTSRDVSGRTMGNVSETTYERI